MTTELATAPSATSTPIEVTLSDEDRAKGVEILLNLPKTTVKRALANGYYLEDTITNVLELDITNDAFLRFIRRVAGFEAPTQRAYVESLLRSCCEQTGRTLREEDVKEKAA